MTKSNKLQIQSHLHLHLIKQEMRLSASNLWQQQLGMLRKQ